MANSGWSTGHYSRFRKSPKIINFVGKPLPIIATRQHHSHEHIPNHHHKHSVHRCALPHVSKAWEAPNCHLHMWHPVVRVARIASRLQHNPLQQAHDACKPNTSHANPQLPPDTHALGTDVNIFRGCSSESLPGIRLGCHPSTAPPWWLPPFRSSVAIPDSSTRITGTHTAILRTSSPTECFRSPRRESTTSLKLQGNHLNTL